MNVALPALVRQLGATTTGLQWVVDAYNLVVAALVLAAGSTADRLGRKGMLLAGLGVFGAASLAGAFTSSTGELIASRAVMGLGAAIMFPATLSLLTGVFTERRQRAAAIGLWGASAGVGVALGPIAGGWLLERFWWGSIFLFMVPVAALVAVLAVWRVPASPRLSRRAAGPVPMGNKIIVGGGIVLVCAALAWISTVSQATSYGIIAAQMVVFGIGMGMTQSPATEAIMGAVPTGKGGIASAVNGSTLLFGGTLGVAVIGSVAASLYTSRLAATLSADLPTRALAAARGSVGGAAVAAQHLSQTGQAVQARALDHAAVLAFLHSLTGGCLVAAAVAGAGALLVALFLSARPRAGHPRTGPAASVRHAQTPDRTPRDGIPAAAANDRDSQPRPPLSYSRPA